MKQERSWRSRVKKTVFCLGLLAALSCGVSSSSIRRNTPFKSGDPRYDEYFESVSSLLYQAASVVKQSQESSFRANVVQLLSQVEKAQQKGEELQARVTADFAKEGGDLPYLVHKEIDRSVELLTSLVGALNVQLEKAEGIEKQRQEELLTKAYEQQGKALDAGTDDAGIDTSSWSDGGEQVPSVQEEKSAESVPLEELIPKKKSNEKRHHSHSRERKLRHRREHHRSAKQHPEKPKKAKKATPASKKKQPSRDIFSP
ncbi:hypothetical protein [Pajaroellobacter abortibovis]|uniref:DUF5667 domain-containing protein n=1 Tax=Pajaroellobacter abortibovis TaxID=1882918 RepID=A0A1L6MYL0_9BACT|nr:hypothetical protein [Pajaroellobacter abortibovis]APS00671.1 hypothetical protein BCY86_08280 [Pajaroellobacter abortibovis]